MTENIENISSSSQVVSSSTEAVNETLAQLSSEINFPNSKVIPPFGNKTLIQYVRVITENATKAEKSLNDRLAEIQNNSEHANEKIILERQLKNMENILEIMRMIMRIHYEVLLEIIKNIAHR
ncbi:MAG: hypothetical protein LBI81_02365 [Puniceicoccales bacterium]|jgi:hypothetical protein|nr:hypothetical protein [Puniceicoccales bacterium]